MEHAACGWGWDKELGLVGQLLFRRGGSLIRVVGGGLLGGGGGERGELCCCGLVVVERVACAEVLIVVDVVDVDVAVVV